MSDYLRPKPERLYCGAMAVFDPDRVGMICMDCFCVVGSVGQPPQCVPPKKDTTNAD